MCVCVCESGRSNSYWIGAKAGKILLLRLSCCKLFLRIEGNYKCLNTKNTNERQREYRFAYLEDVSEDHLHTVSVFILCRV